MKFTCPKCAGKILEEVMIGVIVVSVITKISKDGYFTYGETTNEGGEIANYQCYACGFVVEDEEGVPISNCEDLVSVLSKLR